MKLRRYIANSWGNFGTISLFSKAWEKYVVDRHRFRSNLGRTVPSFPAGRHAPSYEAQGVPQKGKGTPLRICYLIHYFFPDKSGGTERFVLNLAKEQRKLGNDVRVLTLGKRERACYRQQIGNILYEDFEVEGIKVTQFRYRRAPRGLYYDEIYEDDPDMAAFAGLILERESINLVHAAYPQPFFPFLRLCRARNIPYLVTTTDFNIMCHYSTLVDKEGRFCIHSQRGERCREICKTYGLKNPGERYRKAAELLRYAGYVTAPSKFVAQILMAEFDESEILTVPHGISEAFSFSENRRSTKRFLYAGTLSDLKGVHLLISAFLRLPHSGLSLDIYGDGEAGYVRRLKALTKGDPRISFRASVPSSELARVYQKSDCVVVPSMWFETYNFVLREALSCGCLAIASEIGAMPEAVCEGRNGFLFPVGDAEALYASLEKAVSFDWNLYQRASFPRLADEAARYLALYRSLQTEGKLYAEN